MSLTASPAQWASVIETEKSRLQTFHVVSNVGESIFTSEIVTMGIWRQISEYLYIKKRDPNQERTQWMKYMHGINRISILLFLFALIVIVIRLFTKH